MCKQTHAQFAIGFGYVVALMLDRVYPVMNFYLLVLIMPLLVTKGARFPDYDQNWKSISERTTFSWIINKVIHATGGTHRSKHTHSWDICLITLAGMVIGARELYIREIFSNFDYGFSLVLLLGFYSGWVSHLLSDMFNGDGVWLTVFAKRKIAFVPKKLFGFRFNTSGSWEHFFYRVCLIINKGLEVVVILYPLFKAGYFDTLLKYLTI